MPESDKPGFGGYEPPPPTPPPPTLLMVSGLALAFDLATVIALLLHRCSLATILAVLALVFAGATVGMVMRMGSDKPPFGGPEPPPRT
jgi:hypothetical protein